MEGEWGGMGNVGGGAGAGEDKVSKNGCGRLEYCLATWGEHDVEHSKDN